MNTSKKLINKLGYLLKEWITSLLRKDLSIPLSFLIPVIILEIAYLFHDIFPAGDRNVLIIDLYHQYAPFLSELQDKIRSFGSPLYSMSGGLGTSFLPQYAYYLASPLNLIVLLFPKSYLTEAVLVLILLKTGLSGAFFACFIKGAYRSKGLVVAAFSILYALSGYSLAYSWNIMWMEGIYLLPLIILGLIFLIRDGRYLLYTISLGVLLFSNFYIAFFVCFFIMLYFPITLLKYHSIKKPGLLFKRMFQFAGFSVLGVGLSSVLLLPTYYALQQTSAAGESFPKTITHYFDLFDYISRHFTLVSPSIREGMPNIYCGLAVIILLPLYFFSHTISLRDKVSHALLLFFMVVSFNTNILNFIWHGFHFPNQLPYRNSFVYVFLLVALASRAFEKLHEFTGRQIGSICAAFLILVLLTQKLNKQTLDPLSIYVNLLFILIYAIILTLDRGRNMKAAHLALVFFLVVFIEASVNTLVIVDKIDNTEHYSSRAGYLSGKDQEEIRKQLKDISVQDQEFYRVEIIPPKTDNDPFLYNYRGLSIFSSTFQAKPVKMMKNLGFSSNGINSYEYEGSTLILDSLFGIKYLIRRSGGVEEVLRKPFTVNGDISVYKNTYALPLGFIVPTNLKNWHSYSATDPFESQNSLMEGICGIKDLLVPLELKPGNHINATIENSSGKRIDFHRTDQKLESTIVMQLQIQKDQQICLYLDTPTDLLDSGKAIMGEKKIDINARRSTNIDLGFQHAGSIVNVQLKLSAEAKETGNFKIYACGLNQSAFNEAITRIREKSLTIDSISDSTISGYVNAQKGGMMLMSIPFDAGWKVCVDNQIVETWSLDDCLMCFNIPSGTHKIEMRFVPKKFILGLLISISSIFVLCMLFGFTFFKSQRKTGIHNKLLIEKII